MMKKILAAAIIFLAALPAAAGEWTLSIEIGEEPIEALAAGPDGTAWAAMYLDNQIFHFDGASWSVHTVLTDWSGSFWTAFALDSGEVWMYGNFSPTGGGSKVASASVVAYYDGAGWQVFTAPDDSISTLYASGPNDLWLGSWNGVVYRSFNSGADWQSETLPAGAVIITGLAGSSPDSIWAVSQGYYPAPIYAAHYDGVSWTGYTLPDGSSPKVAIPGGIPVCVFWASYDAAVYEFREGAWTQTTVIPGEDNIHLSSAPGATDVWMTGDTGNLYYRNGTDWSVQTTFGEQPYGVSARNGNVWVSTEGRIYRRATTHRPRPPAGDFRGDGTSDIGVFRPASGLWAVRGVTRAYFGTSSDQPVARDYRGDGTSDIGVFRPATGLWAVRGVTRTYFGGSGDTPVPGDYRGDGTSDIGVFRPATGLWAARGVTRAYFGGSSDVPVPGDYRGDGTSDIGVFRPATGLWAVRGVTRAYFGGSSDVPVPGDYRGDGTADIAVFRQSSGLWAVRGVTRAYFGQPGDIQVINPLLPPPR